MPVPDSSQTRFGSAVLALLAGTLLAGLFSGWPSSEETAGGGSAATGPDSINTLTEAERQAGWHLLFDGDSFKGWRGYARDTVPAGWRIDEGALHFTGEASSEDDTPPLTLITTETYDNFELRIEWKISPDGNSGILYRVTEETDRPYKTGPEYQVLDNAVLGTDGEAVHRAGALYGLYTPSENATRPVGTYNEARIVVRGSHVEHWMNGTKLLTAEIGGTSWTDRVDDTKFADWPLFARATAGHIALQDHGAPVWYRDVKIRPLETTD